jgi:GT2 family glycosyltransferase
MMDLNRVMETKLAVDKLDREEQQRGSSESVQLVHSLYCAAFGCLANPEALAGYVGWFPSGNSLHVVAEDIVRSAAFQDRHGSEQAVNHEFVTALYRNGLGREPDSSGLAYWLSAGEDGKTRAMVLAEFAGSDESRERCHAVLLVHSLYKTAFGQLADRPYLAYGIDRLQSDRFAEGLASELVNHPGFLARYGFSQEVDAKYIRAIYANSLGRRPDFESLAYWLAERRKGATPAEILAAVASSDEALEKVVARDLGPDALYRRWVAENDALSEVDRALIGTHIASLPLRPIISVVMISGWASEGALCESVVSVTEQLYPYWELIIAANNVLEQTLSKVLPSSATNDLRMRIVQVEGPGSAAANEAIKTATGDFVMLLRAGDLLPEQALYELAIEIDRNPSADVVYGDCDEITANGKRRNPWFKPGWDPDLLLGQDYINAPVVYRLALLQQVGFLRREFEGAELYDLALRATAQTRADRIRHIPAILCHRSKVEPNHEDPAGVVHSRKLREWAVRERLNKDGYTNAIIRAAPQMPGGFHIVWPLPPKAPLVSVIVPTRDRAHLLAECAEGVLQRTGYSNLEFLIVDNESTEERTHELFERLCREDKRVRVLSMPGPFNYSKLNNQAAKEANGEVLLLLNNDVAVIDSDWLRELVSQAIRPDVGMVGAKLLYPNGKVQHGGIVIGPGPSFAHIQRLADRNNPGYFGQLALVRTLQAVTGACAAIRRSVFFEAGGLNETDLEVAFNDVDLCLRLSDLGYRVVWTPFAELFHLESVSRGYEDTPEKQERTRRELLYVMKTFASLFEAGDPFHNPNLLFAWDESKIPAPSRRESPWYYLAEHVSDLHRHFSRALARLDEPKHP